MKLTRPEDLAQAEAILTRLGESGMYRSGIGYDAHKLVAGRKLILGGVEIPHPTGLLGHSDADVLVHAVMDALLGAAALGDIGKHFPDNDPAYEGASSLLLLERVSALLNAEGWRVVNIDSVIVAQKPRLMPHIPAMIDHIAECLNIQSSAVSVKATTTERMGYEGREEGISAQAVAMIRRG
jgi:2-C-methyl-D-erythritol 2,4-cyclodiphosphate synthase